MSQKKLRAPEGATAFSHAGVEYKVTDGHIIIPEAAEATAITFGYGAGVAVKDAEEGLQDDLAATAAKLSPEAIAEMDRAKLLKYCEDNRLTLPEGRASDKDLREIVLAHATETLRVMKAASQVS